MFKGREKGAKLQTFEGYDEMFITPSSIYYFCEFCDLKSKDSET